MNRKPLVSIIIPTYYRRSVVNTVESALGQSYNNVETIVVDDSGEGASEQWLSDYSEIELHLLESNRGSNEAREYGFRKSSGEFIHFLDDDDTIRPEKIEAGIDKFQSDSSLSVVYSGVRFKGKDSYPDCKGEVLESALKFDLWPCMTSTMLIKRGAIERSDLFRELPGADDLQMMIELAKAGHFDFQDEILVDKSPSPDARGASRGAFKGRFEIIEMYSDLYEQHPETVCANARANAEFNKAQYFLDNQLWSQEAVYSMINHCRWKTNPGPVCVFKIVSSLFGRPGWQLGNWLNDHLTSK